MYTFYIDYKLACAHNRGQSLNVILIAFNSYIIKNICINKRIAHNY